MVFRCSHIKKYNLEDRVTTLNGDIQKDDIKDRYDLVLCSNILHLLPQKQKVLKKIYTSLNKNGILLILQNNFLEYLQKNQHTYFYNIISLFQNKDKLDDMEFSNMILDSGFKSVNSFLSEESLHINTKVYIAKK
ncbi:MAG: methyltransferase domain-containing protein [Campylobacterota bacterium]|nr:methyltransferase domain-containing protein [Campylobacterota bacterium]